MPWSNLMSHKHLSQRYFNRGVYSNKSLHQALIPSNPSANWKENHILCLSAWSDMNEQRFLSTVDLCCFWSSSQSHLCLICSNSGPSVSSHAISTGNLDPWKVSGCNVQDSIQLVSARKDRLHQKPNFCSSFWVANCHTFSCAVQFYCFSGNIAHCLNEELPNVFTSRKPI